MLWCGCGNTLDEVSPWWPLEGGVRLDADALDITELDTLVGEAGDKDLKNLNKN